jgi:hypothetical protein
MKIKKPPDTLNNTNIANFRTIKVPLKKILKHYELIQPKFTESVLRVNQFATLSYEFIKLYILTKFDNNEIIPKINKAFITKIYSLIGQGSAKGRKCQKKNDELQIFYDNIFSKIYPEKLNSSHLSYVLPILSDEIIRCLETNIKTHFIKYIQKYVNVIIKAPLLKKIKTSNYTKDERKPLYQILNTEMRAIKSDLINQKCEQSNIKYHEWLNIEINKLFPFRVEKSIAYDVKVSPQKYIIPAIMINKAIEALGKTPYQVFCQRSNLIPKTITLNTSGLIEVINDKKKEIYKVGYSEMNNNARKYQKQTWREILKLENKQIFDHKDYVFYNQIQTDGVCANILFINKNYINKKYGEKLPSYNEDIDFEIKQLEQLSKIECDAYKNKILLGIDPGKKDILTMINENGRTYSYSNCRRRNDTYTKRSNQITLNEKKNNGIIELETKLSSHNKKSLLANKFISYLSEKKNSLIKLRRFYENPLFRKLTLRRFCRTKSSEDKMLNEIEKHYGKKEDLILGLGDWSVNSSPNQMKGCMPTPNKGLIKLLKKRFTVLSVDEFRTSKLYNKDLSKELINVKVKRGKKNKSIHTLLTPTRNPNGVMLNRDVNASRNILKILKTYLNSQTRPLEFCRTKALQH